MTQREESKMREIKFRALSDTIAGMKWVYGYYVYQAREHCIVKKNGTHVIVDGTTVGQYTGSKDENKKEIYEGDVAEIYDELLKKIVRAKIVLEAGAFRFDYNGKMPILHSSCKIIGNIYENPELLK